MPTKTLKRPERDVLEYASAAGPRRVDREKGVIYGVKILGPRSRNGGEYTERAMQEAVPLYEGAKVNLDHPSRNEPGKDRAIQDRFGKFAKVRYESKNPGGPGLYGDLHFNTKHRMAEYVCEAAERMPDTLGCSHNARVRDRQLPDGRTVYEAITRVRSVDLVADPATTKSLFESENQMNDPHSQGPVPDDAPPPETAVDTPAAAEAPPEETPPVPEETTPAEDPGAADEDIGMTHMIETIKKIAASGGDSATKAKQIYQAVKLLLQVGEQIEAMDANPAVGLDEEAPPEEEAAVDDEEEAPAEEEPAGDEAPAEEPAPDEEEEEPVKECDKKKRESLSVEDYDAALSVLESVKVTPTRIRIRAVAMLPTPEERKALAETWTGSVLESQVVPTREIPRPRSTSVLESSRTEQAAKPTVVTPEQVERDAKLLMSG